MFVGCCLLAVVSCVLFVVVCCVVSRICDLNATCDRGPIARTSVACRTGEGEKKYIYIYI